MPRSYGGTGAVANVSSMNWKKAILPSFTVAWMEKSDRTAWPRETER